MINFKSIDEKGKVEAGRAANVKKAGPASFERELKAAGVLEDAFLAFSSASDSLKEYYGLLEKKVGELNKELAHKSGELEESLKKTSQMERYQSNILQGLSSAVIVLDRAGNVTTFNRMAEEISGFSYNEVKGRKLSLIIDEENVSRILEGETKGNEIVYISRRGGTFHLRTSTSSLIDDSGERDGTIIILHDVTREKMLEESMERGKKLAAMGEMAAKLAHEIRNPLGGIELFASNLKKNLADNPRASNMAENICSAVASLNYLVTNTLQFARMKKPVIREMSLIETIDEAVILVSHLIHRQGITVRKDYSSGPVLMNGDREMMKQAFLNVIINAVQSMGEGGAVDISLRPGMHNEIKVIISDEGEGILGDVKERMFEPFYSTKESGSGLGLAIVYNIIQAHHGTVSFNSKVGEGTDVIFSLPIKFSENQGRRSWS